MAESILIIAVVFFAFRGYFLALPGVIGRLIGLVAAYVFAFSFRDDLGQLLNAQFNNQYPAIAAEALAGIVIFLCSLIGISVGIKLFCRGVGKLVPPLAPLFDDQRLASRIGGVLANGAFAAAIVMVGIWGAGQLIPQPSPSPLQHAANRFGSLLFDEVLNQYEDWRYTETRTIVHRPDSGSATTTATTATTKTLTTKGTAIIQSATKTMRLEEEYPVQTEEPPKQAAGELLIEMMKDEQVQERLQSALNNEQLRNMAEDYLKENPQAVQEALNNPQIQELLKQFQTQ